MSCVSIRPEFVTYNTVVLSIFDSERYARIKAVGTQEFESPQVHARKSLQSKLLRAFSFETTINPCSARYLSGVLWRASGIANYRMNFEMRFWMIPKDCRQ